MCSLEGLLIITECDNSIKFLPWVQMADPTFHLKLRGWDGAIYS